MIPAQNQADELAENHGFLLDSEAWIWNGELPTLSTRPTPPLSFKGSGALIRKHWGDGDFLGLRSLNFRHFILTGTAVEVDDFVNDAHVCILAFCLQGIVSSNTGEGQQK